MMILSSTVKHFWGFLDTPPITEEYHRNPLIPLVLT